MTRTLVALLLASLTLAGCYVGPDRGYDNRGYGYHGQGGGYQSEHHEGHGQYGSWSH